MEIVLVTVAFVVVVGVVVRIAVGFVRWSRAHQPEAGQWALGLYLRTSLGDWVDRTSDSHHGPSTDGGGHHHSHHHHHHSDGGHHHHDAGFHSGDHGGHGSW